MDDIELERINRERAKRGLPPLSRTEASRASTEYSSRSDSDDGISHFLIGYLTGIPMPSPSGIMGAMLHSTTESSAASTPDTSAGDSPSYSSPEPSSSSSSYDSSSSSSYDSGSSSSSSGDSGGGGGGE